VQRISAEKFLYRNLILPDSFVCTTADTSELPAALMPTPGSSRKSDFNRTLTRRLVRPPSNPQRLTLRYGYSRDRLSDRRIHRQIEGGTRSAHVSKYTVRNQRQKTIEAKEPRKSAIHSSARCAVQRFRSCSPNCSSADTASTTTFRKAGFTDVLRTGRANSQSTCGNPFIRTGSHAV
jgi:hypothetical protein